MSAAEVRFERIATNGITLNVAQAGPADGPLLVLLHGFPEFWYEWHKHLPALAAARFCVWAPDQRGYNTSDKPPQVRDYTLDHLAADVIGLIDAAGRERAIVVGHDWGGAVAWWLASNQPERLEKLVIINVPHPLVMRRLLRTSPRQLLRSWYMFVM
jgi:pimeloyl-ACP methyl ester carboxylesterase